ncbi:MAG: EamA family transporter, partial [Chthoniobacterales bacterium]
AGQQMLCGGTVLALVGMVTGEGRRFNWEQIGVVSLGAFLYLVLIGAIVGYVAYAWLLRHCEPAKVATYAYVNPVVAVLLGALFAGEKITGLTALAAFVIVCSVALVITGGRRKDDPTSEMACPAPAD